MDKHYIKIYTFQGAFNIELFKDLIQNSNAYLSFDVILDPPQN